MTTVASSTIGEASTTAPTGETTTSFEMTRQGIADQSTTSAGRPVENTMNAETAAAVSAKMTSAAGSTDAMNDQPTTSEEATLNDQATAGTTGANTTDRTALESSTGVVDRARRWFVTARTVRAGAPRGAVLD